jgi:hypothetical protein
MDQLDLSKQTSRRSVVKTGVKIAYAAPLVAASFKLGAHGASAALVCPGTYTLVLVGPPDSNGNPTGPTCCLCACTTFNGNLVQTPQGPHCVDAFGIIDECLFCDSGLTRNVS